MKNSKFIFRIGLFIASLFIFTNCEDSFLNDIAMDADAASKGPGNGGNGGDPVESVGANLSFPVLWSEGVEKTLRTAPADAVNGVKLAGAWWYVWGPEPVDPESIIYSCNPLVAGTTCYGTATDVYKAYLQKDANNFWEAYNETPSEPVNVDLVDWGDNLESIDWGITSKVRTEVVLYEGLTSQVLEYAMRHVSGWGTDEMHGLQTTTDGVIQYGPGMQATVYSPHARLTIQKLNSTTPDVTWSASAHAWTGADASAPVFNKAVWEALDGPGYYNAEINIKGKVIYGYTWDVKKANSGPGVYRITFSFDDTAGSVSQTLKTHFDGSTTVLQPLEEEVGVTEATPVELRKGKIDAGNNLTYIDVNIKASQGGGKNKPTL